MADVIYPPSAGAVCLTAFSDNKVVADIAEFFFEAIIFFGGCRDRGFNTAAIIGCAVLADVLVAHAITLMIGRDIREQGNDIAFFFEFTEDDGICGVHVIISVLR